MNKLGIVLISIFAALVAFHLLIIKPEKYESVDIYDEMMERGYIRVGINIDSKPFGFTKENGQICGYDADLSRYISKYIFPNKTQSVVFVPVTPSDRLLKISTGEVDIVVATMTITPQREQLINFSIPYDSAGQAILVKKTSKITSLADLADQNVGVIWGTTAEKNIRNLIPSANITGFKSYMDAYKALKRGDILALTSDDTLLSRFVQEDSEVRMLPKRYTREPYGIGFKQGKGSAKFRNVLDFAINDLKQKNVINKLHKQWLGSVSE